MVNTKALLLGSDDGDAARFRALPEHVRLEDTIAVQACDPPPDPTLGRDPDLGWLLRTAG